MKKWKRMLAVMFSVVMLAVIFGILNFGAANASELHRSSGVNGRLHPHLHGQLQSRAWGSVIGENGANFRVRHYQRHTNGSTTFLSQSTQWGTNGARIYTVWSDRAAALTVGVLVNVTTW